MARTAVAAPAPEPRPAGRLLDSVAIGRSAGDILSRTLRLTFGGKQYVLPVLTIAGNRRWMAQVERELGAVLDGLRKAGARSNAIGLHAVLSGQIDQMLDLITAYDTTGVLPDRAALEETTYEIELLDAIQEVWRAANPLVAIAIARMQMSEVPTSDTSEPTSSPPPNGAGRRRRSKRN